MGKIYAILGDIHANIDALAAVLEDAAAQGVTDYACVGDVVGYNAAPAECLRIVRDELGCPVVRGNHDHYVANMEQINLDDFTPAAAEVIRWTREQLSDDETEWLAHLPMQKPLAGFTLVHSTLDMPNHWGYVFEDHQAMANFNYQNTTICFHGHTHVPIIYLKDGSGVRHFEPCDFQPAFGQKLFLNVGSVGQPRDGDPRASYVIYDKAERIIRYRRVAYDVAAAQARNRAAGLPEKCAARLELGR